MSVAVLCNTTMGELRYPTIGKSRRVSGSPGH